jgi:tellurite resistance protein TehA-like permease
LTPRSPLPSTVAWLGYGGLIPFVAAAAVAVVGGDYAGFCSYALFAYGAVILSFVGAVHWGFALTCTDLSDQQRNATWAWSVVPALLAWLALLVTPAAAGVILVAGFVAQYLQDRKLSRHHSLPAWYLPLRLRLTSVACACLAAGAFAARQYATRP